MSDDRKPEVDTPDGHGADDPLPPFEPDEDLITHLEAGRDRRSQVDTGRAGAEEPPPPFDPDEELITYLERGRKEEP